MEEGFEVAVEGQDHEGFQDDHSYDENGQLAAEEGEVIEGSRVAVEIQGREGFVGDLLCEADGQISFTRAGERCEGSGARSTASFPQYTASAATAHGCHDGGGSSSQSSSATAKSTRGPLDTA